MAPKEQEQQPYYQAVRFVSEYTERRTYAETQKTIHDERNSCDLSIYRFLLNGVWHVSVLGETPPDEVDQKLTRILERGEPTSLPEEVLSALFERREDARKQGSWVERHYRRRRL